MSPNNLLDAPAKRRPLREGKALLDGGAKQLANITERKRTMMEALRESEQKFLTSVETLLDGFGIFSAIRDEAGHIVDFRYEYINDSGCQLNQRSREEQIGHTLLELLPAHKGTGLFDEYVQVVETGQPLAKESVLYEDVWGGGQRLARAFDLRAVKLNDGFAVNWRDITEEKQAEEALLLSEEKFRFVIDALPMRVTYVDSEQRYRFSNKVCEECFGQSCTEIVGKHVWEVLGGSAYQVIRKHIEAALSGRMVTYESIVPYKDGGTRRINATYVPRFGGKGEVQGFFTLAYDITEHKRAEEMTSAVALRGSLTPLQKRFLKSGFEGFSDREMIELLLSQNLPYKGCRKLAKECIELFKNLRGFLAASAQELERVGLTSSSLFCVKLLHELPTEVLKGRIVKQSVYKSSEEVFAYLSYVMRDLKKEVFKVIYLNNRNQIIEIKDLFEGTFDSIPIRPREIVESAIKHKATALIFAHNHPTGDPTPSRSDKQLTRDLVFIGNILQIKVLDHIIIGENTYFSFADDGLIQKYEDNFLNMKMRGGI